MPLTLLSISYYFMSFSILFRRTQWTGHELCRFNDDLFFSLTLLFRSYTYNTKYVYHHLLSFSLYIWSMQINTHIKTNWLHSVDSHPANRKQHGMLILKQNGFQRNVENKPSVESNNTTPVYSPLWWSFCTKKSLSFSLEIKLQKIGVKHIEERYSLSRSLDWKSGWAENSIDCKVVH